MEDDTTLEYGRSLRQKRQEDATATEKEQLPEDGDLSENQEDEKTAENNMLWLSIASDTLGALPFVGGIVRALAGLAIHFQALKLNATVRMKTLVMNGMITLLQILLSFFGLNVLPLASLGRMIVKRAAGNTAQTDKS